MQRPHSASRQRYKRETPRFCSRSKNHEFRRDRNKNKTSENWARNGREIPLKMHYSISTQTNLDDSAGGRSDTWPKVGAFLGNRAGDGGTLDFTFGVNDDASVV
jgi:hypothetical protein